MSQHKRPIPRPLSRVPSQFVSRALPGGGIASEWKAGVPKPRIPTGHPSVVGQILDKMRQGPNPTGPKKKEWTPPVEYEFVAKHMQDPENFLQRCKAWYDTHPVQTRVTNTDTSNLDLEPISDVYKKYMPELPPLSEREKAWRVSGYTEAKIQKALAYYKRMDETSEARQEALDLIFAKFPSASKPTPKAKVKKVIKVVKKKMPGSSNE